jgi:hypothetical protein
MSIRRYPRKGQIGREVRLRGNPRKLSNLWRTARIERRLHDVPGGVVLDRPLDGLRYWNVDALEYVR